MNAHASRAVTARPRERVDLGVAWWAALVVVSTALGLVGLNDRGFLSVFLWSVVGFVLGSLVAIAVRGRVARDGSREVLR
ncbi:hypothetical protein ACFQU3_07035 [Terrabacter sp. GCM10028922]|uniref:hypothetical protein n=1 Tax=Terrabacter sp. GCM10028922 TaxID=3273428 RepID=UPI003618BF4B